MTVRQLNTRKRFSLRGGVSIPWMIAERAYVTYVALFGTGESLESLSKRCAWSMEELEALASGDTQTAKALLNWYPEALLR